MRFDNDNNMTNIPTETATGNTLAVSVMFNKKSFNDKVFLSLEMVNNWDQSLVAMNHELYKDLCDKKFSDEIENLRSNNQYDIALLKFLNYLNPKIPSILKNIIDSDNKVTNNDSLITKGKLKYRGGELIPYDVYNHETYTISGLPTTGETVYTQNKQLIKLGKLVGDGGEGLVYLSSKRNEVIKLIKPDNNGGMRTYTQRRIEQMVKMKINNPNVIWPIDTIYNAEKQFIGFSMQYISGIDLKKFTSSIVRNVNDGDGEVNINSTNKKTLCKLILSILDTIIYLHDKNIIIGDIKLENFMIQEEDITNVFFIDCDSYQLGNFPCLLVSPGFIPPEIDSANIGKQNSHFRTFGNENYAVFSLLFHLVFRAKPPYSQQIHNDKIVAESVRVSNGLFPYFLRKEQTLRHAPKGMEEPIWAHLPGYIKEAFINNAHLSGKNFGEENRFSPRQWKHIFTCYLDDLNGTRLQKVDPLCNQYHYGLKDTIDYDIVDLPIPPHVTIKQGLSSEETIIQRFRNNNYIKNMILTDNVNVRHFDYALFNNKLYDNKILLSLELIKNWNLGLKFIQNEQLGAFDIDPTQFSKISSSKNSGNFELALFDFIRALNPSIYLAYDGLIFNTVDEYALYLNNYYWFSDKSIIPFDILEQVIENQTILRELYVVFSKKRMTSLDIDIIINLLTTSGVYSNGIHYKTLDNFLVSVYKNELGIKLENLLANNSIARFILKKYDIDSSQYDFTRKEGYFALSFKTSGCIPFRYNEHVFFSMNDIINYSKLEKVSFEERFNNIGRWINNGVLKNYSNLNPSAQRIKTGNEVDVYQLVADHKLNNWEAGHLFYLANVRNPIFITEDKHMFKDLAGLMETLIEIDDIERFTEGLYSNILFDFWCDLHKKIK
ncbi:MAG: hypothetical protein R3Y60_03065 [bacterium]